MITVVMPYWERYEAARRTLLSYDEFYNDDVKVIIVDDGSPSQPAKELEQEFDRLTVVEMPVKTEVKNPCTPMNVGARLVDTDFIGLSNPETFHVGPSLYEMVSLLKEENDYILAPAFCPETEEWHCHPDLHPMLIPKGTGFHHMALMKKELWDKVDSMDDDYRDGYCFDDADFIMRLVDAEAKFMYSEMPVFHSRAGAKARMNRDSWLKNRTIYCQKWQLENE